jgi:hypothetical protein
MVSLDEYLDLLDDRPRKFTAKEVGYQAAPEGSVLRCATCLHFFHRAIDNFSVCEIFRSEETDRNGVKPHWRCGFWTLDGSVHPLLEKEEEEIEEQESLRDA